MKKYKKALFVLAISMLLLAGVGTVKAQAAVSRSKAITMYNSAIRNWGKKYSTTTIVHALHSGSGVYSPCGLVGKRVSLRPLYTGSPRYIFADLNGDGTVEALFYNSRYIYLFTIYGGKVRSLGAICVHEANTPVYVYYNSKLKTFSLRMNPILRMTVVKNFRIRNGRLSYLNSFGRYTGPMNSNFKMQYEYFVNGYKRSNAYYRKYYSTYIGSARRYNWGP